MKLDKALITQNPTLLRRKGDLTTAPIWVDYGRNTGHILAMWADQLGPTVYDVACLDDALVMLTETVEEDWYHCQYDENQMFMEPKKMMSWLGRKPTDGAKPITMVITKIGTKVLSVEPKVTQN